MPLSNRPGPKRPGLRLVVALGALVGALFVSTPTQASAQGDAKGDPGTPAVGAAKRGAKSPAARRRTA
ncbi:MAG: hypothetical protein HOQ26_05355, partial [Gemmatimonadaceae bacterium]|nr:hypothetical protein [Gemmatimonadaceae bacterium]